MHKQILATRAIWAPPIFKVSVHTFEASVNKPTFKMFGPLLCDSRDNVPLPRSALISDM